jgi:hypothetical protein
MMSDFDHWSYERREIDRALRGQPEGELLRLKIMGEQGESRWLLVTPQQVRAIRELIAPATPDLDAAAAILAEKD